MTEIDGVPADLSDVKALALMNYGHFTSMRLEQGGVRGFSLHLDRLVRDCRLLFDTNLDVDRARDVIRHAITNVPRPVVVRVTVFDPHLELGHPGGDASPQVLVTTRGAASASLPPLRLTAAEYARDLPLVKHVGLFGTVWHRRTAQRTGFDDVLFTDSRGAITEGATWNIGFIAGDQVIWPEADCLNGVTMDLLKQAYPNTAVKRLAASEVAGMSAAFVTNAAIGLRPVAALDDAEWPVDHPVLAELRSVYSSIPLQTI